MTAKPPLDADPLRIGFVAWQFPMLSEPFISTLALDLLARGHDLRVLTLDPDDRGEAIGPMHDEVARSDLLARTCRLGRAPIPGRLAKAWLALGAGKFDVIHCHFASLGLPVDHLRRLGLLRTHCLVVHVRGYDVTSFVDGRGSVYDRLFRNADQIIANCDHFRERALALGCPAEKAIVIGSPIDATIFHPPASREPYDARPLRLVGVGRLVEKKGFEDAIAALAILRGWGLNAELRLLGEGPLRPVLEARIAELGLTDAARLEGQATQGEIVSALHWADIALAPCVRAASGNEDAPVNTLKEAMATGLPVVATRHGGIPELVIPGENGALVPEHDPAALAGAIREMAARPQEWARLGAAGRERVVTQYDRDAVCERTISAYRRCLGDRR